MFGRVRISKKDEGLLRSKVEHMIDMYTCCYYYEKEDFLTNTIEAFRPIIKLCKVCKKEFPFGHNVDLTNRHIYNYYTKSMESLKIWGKKYKFELVNITVKDSIRLCFISGNTGDKITFYISNSEVE